MKVMANIRLQRGQKETFMRGTFSHFLGGRRTTENGQQRNGMRARMTKKRNESYYESFVTFAMSQDNESGDTRASPSISQTMKSENKQLPGRRVLATVALGTVAPFVGLNIIQDLGFDFGDDNKPASLPPVNPSPNVMYKEATFAGGCFWCMEEPFDIIDGVVATTSGYMGGKKENPTYREVSSGSTGHAESVRVLYDPNIVGYEQLLDAFFHSVDPTTKNRQFVDQGTQYRTAIFVYDEQQKRAAERFIEELESQKRFGSAPIVTEVTPAGIFYPAENYHQNYYLNNASKYNFYRSLSGRDEYIQSIWGKK